MASDTAPAFPGQTLTLKPQISGVGKKLFATGKECQS